jgi:hypothetical protein
MYRVPVICSANRRRTIRGGACSGERHVTARAVTEALGWIGKTLEGILEYILWRHSFQ